MKFKVNYVNEKSNGIEFHNPSLTQQQFKAECDINTILDKYQRTGILNGSMHDLGEPQYMDCTTVTDFQSAQTLLARTKEQFEALPSRIRDRFANDPAQLLAFIADDGNYEEAKKLGLLDPEKAELRLSKVNGIENGLVNLADVEVSHQQDVSPASGSDS